MILLALINLMIVHILFSIVPELFHRKIFVVISLKIQKLNFFIFLIFICL